jgi:topoisomerase IV subunit A
MKDTDRLLRKFDINTTDTLLLFTTKGNYLYLPVHELPDIRWKDPGQHVAGIVPIDSDDSILEAIPIKDFSENKFLLFITKQGMTKRTELINYKAQRYSKPLIALKLKGDDELVDVYLTDGNEEVFLATHSGYGLWFNEEDVNIVGTRAAGVKGINLKKEDFVVGGLTKKHEDNVYVVVVTQRGAVKKMRLDSEFEKTARAKRGVVMLRELKAHPHRIVAVAFVNGVEKIWIQAEKGKKEFIEVNSLRPADRYNNGSFIMDIDETGEIVEVWKDDKTELE